MEGMSKSTADASVTLGPPQIDGMERREGVFGRWPPPPPTDNGTGVKNAEEGKRKWGFWSPVMRWVDDPWMTDMCVDFSLHALPRAYNMQSSYLRRLIWFLLFLCGSAATLAAVIITIKDYFQFESITSIYDESPGPQGIPFPAVTIWNHNPIRASSVAGTQYDRDVCGVIGGLNQGGVYSAEGLPEGWNVSMSWEAAHKLEDMLVECEWRGKPCSSEDFFPALTPAPNTRWGIGHTFNHLSTSFTKQAGRLGGLHLVLDIQPEEHCSGVWESGIRVQFHDHHELPESVSATHINPLLGDTVSPGARWSFSLKRRESHTLGEPYSAKCIDLKGGDEFPNPNAARECAENCPGVNPDDLTEIFLLSTSNQCVINCFAPRNDRFCDAVTFTSSLGHSHLTSPRITTVSQEVVDTLSKGELGRIIPENAINMTSQALMESIQESLNRNIVVIDIFYKEMLVERHQEVAQQSVWAMIGEVGGLIGLFLGASLVTGFEFVEILLMLMCSFTERKQQTTSENSAIRKITYTSRRNLRLQNHRAPPPKTLLQKYRTGYGPRGEHGSANLQNLHVNV